MQPLLSDQLNSILEKGVNIVQEHREPILLKWESKLIDLKTKRRKSTWRSYKVVADFFTEFLFVNRAATIDDLFREMHEHKKAMLNPIEPNELMFVITLIENIVHEVIQSEIGHAYEKHQAVQYFFSKINEEIFSETKQQYLNIHTFLEQFVASRQLPILWIAKISKLENGFRIDKMFSQIPYDETVTFAMEADSLFKLSEHLLELFPSDSTENRVFPIPWGEDILLFCSKEPESEVVPFIMFSMQTFLNGENAVQTTKRHQQWMDAVILFNEWIMRSKTYNEALDNITSGFVNYLPFERCALFAYSNDDQSGFGLNAHSLNSDEIKQINVDLDHVPFIKKYIQKLELLGTNAKNVQPLYVSKAAAGLPSEYVEQFDLASIVIVPIYVASESKLLGAAIIDQGPRKTFKLSRETFLALMRFGHSAGEVLVKFVPNPSRFSKNIGELRLSPREIQVLELIAEGKSTNEAAQKLHLSEYTVRDYVSTIMQKMEAKNRTEAIVKAIREGII